MSNGLVKYKTDAGVEISITPQDVRDLFASGNAAVSDKEVSLFLGLCQAQGLNPFLREAYLVKYSDKHPATLIVGKEAFTKRAYTHPLFEGFEAGVTIVTKDGALEQRQGSLVGSNTETLVGGWARVYVKDRKVPYFEEVSLQEYMGFKRDYKTGEVVPTEMWASKPATMIRKVALVHALREAFPERFSGLYDESEMGGVSNDEVLITNVVDVSPEPAEKPVAPVESNPEAAAINAKTSELIKQIMTVTGEDKGKVVNAVLSRFRLDKSICKDSGTNTATAQLLYDRTAEYHAEFMAPETYEEALEDIPF